MPETVLEHANLTVSDLDRTADMLCDLFGWHVRWQSAPGGSLDGGTSWHVGGEESYVAIYTIGGRDKPGNSYSTPGAMNHLGVVVDDLDTVEAKAKARGLEPYSHADYEPGRRFYFRDHDGIEFEVVSYR
jgi:catechol 2,3-dioxygenase-like lactoylglutathione lyase family enzyme